MYCHHCGKSICGSDMVCIVRPMSFNLSHDFLRNDLIVSSDGDVDYVPSMIKISMETNENYILSFHKECFEEVAGKDYIPG